MAILISPKFLLSQIREAPNGLFLPMLILSCPQPKIIHMPKWHMLGWHSLIPFSFNVELRNGTMTENNCKVKERLMYLH